MRSALLVAMLLCLGIALWLWGSSPPSAEETPRRQAQARGAAPRGGERTATSTPIPTTPFTAAVGGVVRDSKGQAIPGAIIVRLGSGGVTERWEDLPSTLSDAEGRFSLEERGATGHLLVFAPGYRIGIFDSGAVGQLEVRSSSEALLVHSGGSPLDSASVSWAFDALATRIVGLRTTTDGTGSVSIPFPIDTTGAHDSAAIAVDVQAEGFVTREGVVLADLPASATGLRRIELSPSFSFLLKVTGLPEGVSSVPMVVTPMVPPFRALTVDVALTEPGSRVGVARVEGAPPFSDAHVDTRTRGISVAVTQAHLDSRFPLAGGQLVVPLGRSGTIRGELAPPPGKDVRWSAVMERPAQSWGSDREVHREVVPILSDGTFQSPPLKQGGWRVTLAGHPPPLFDDSAMSSRYPVPSPLDGLRHGSERNPLLPRFRQGVLTVILNETDLHQGVTLFTTRRARLLVSARTAKGDLLPEVSFEMRRQPRSWILGRGDPADRVDSTGETGEVALEIKPGTWEFRFTKVGYGRATVHDFEVLPGGAHSVCATLQRPEEVVVALRARDTGAALSRVRIEAHALQSAAFDVHDLVEEATSDDDGRVIFRMLGAGSYLLRLVGGVPEDLGLVVADQLLAKRELTIRVSADDIGPKTVDLERCARLYGRVVDQSGIPARNAWIYLRCAGSGARVPPISSDSEGRFDVLLARGGSYEVWKLAVPRQVGESIPSRLDVDITSATTLQTGSAEHRLVFVRK